MSNFDINVDRQTDGRTEKRTPMSQSQEVREMFHARFDGCFVVDKNTNFDINVERRHKC